MQREEKICWKIAERLDVLAHLHPNPERGVQYADLLKKRWGLEGRPLRGSIEMATMLGCSQLEIRERAMEALFVFADIARRIDWAELKPGKLPKLAWPDRGRVDAILRGEIPTVVPANASSTAANGQKKTEPLPKKKILRALSLDPSKPYNHTQIRAVIAELKRQGVLDELRGISEISPADKKALRILELRYLSRAEVRGYQAVAKDYSTENPTRAKVNTLEAQKLDMAGLLLLHGYVDSL